MLKNSYKEKEFINKNLKILTKGCKPKINGLNKILLYQKFKRPQKIQKMRKSIKK